MPDDIQTPMDAVEAAFNDVSDDAVIDIENKDEGTPSTAPTSAPNQEDKPDAHTDDDSTDDNQGPEGAPADEELIAPAQVRGEFAKTHWGQTPTEAKKEIIRLAEENEKNYRRAAEAEYNAKHRREVLKPVIGYVKQVAEQAKISEDEVIRNSLDIIQALNDNPVQTARQMIAGNFIHFDDPVAVIDTIAKTYGLDIKHDYKPSNVPADYYKMKQAREYEQRQAKYVGNDTADDPQAQADQAVISEFLASNPELNTRMEQDSDFSAAFLATVTHIAKADPYAPRAEILSRALKQFTITPSPQTAQTTIVEKKTKVVAPQRTNPSVSKNIDSNKTWTRQNANQESSRAAHNAVLDAMRSLGLDE